jgi:hypothetical protein
VELPRGSGVFLKCKKPCSECNASKDAAPANLWYKTLEKGKRGFKKVSNEEAMKNPGSGHSLFRGMIPGLAQRWSGEIVFTYCSPSGWYHTLSLLA